ncbi:MAG TPA: hypothetical protein PK095_14010 [Myxococcota bacterium]|nr:hypothetical protein [Myxococcota bacterium]
MAIVAEGPTDAVIIEAALSAILPPFILTLLQPEETRPALGAGWGGVLRWCLDFSQRGARSLEADPTLPGFDLFILHIDADVAGASYEALGNEVASLAQEHGWPSLPTVCSCPPACACASVVGRCVCAWAGLESLGARTVLCVPSRAVEAWLVAAVFDESEPILEGLECRDDLSDRIAGLPLKRRIRKSRRDYAERASLVRERWSLVRGRCTQAERFSLEVAAAVATR